MSKAHQSNQALAEAITKTASKQTYYTIRFFADRDLVPLAFQAYAYFRWVDDVLDGDDGTGAEKITFADRQAALLEACYRDQIPADLCPEERMLADLVKSDTEPNSGLRSYLDNMMAVMAFDAGRRGTSISREELSQYTHALAVAVTDALHYFIGHDQPPPMDGSRYLAVTAAHITHMLRDAHEDVRAGYYNIPREYLLAQRISPQETEGLAYRAWVCQRVSRAQLYFKAGRRYLARVKNLRCRLVGFAYAARFEWMLRTIGRENYCLRSEYPDRKGLRAGLWIAWKTLASFLVSPGLNAEALGLVVEPVRINDV